MYEMNENIDKAIKASRTLGCITTNIGAADIQKGTNYYITLGLLWQLVSINLKRQVKKQIMTLDTTDLTGNDDEAERDAFLAQTPEAILLCWFNKHLENAGHPNRATNFHSDISDSVKYCIVLHSINPELCPMTVEEITAIGDRVERAKHILEEAEKLECKKFVNANDIATGVERKNFAFVALLFQKYPGMKERIITPAVDEVVEETPIEEEVPIPEPVVTQYVDFTPEVVQAIAEYQKEETKKEEKVDIQEYVVLPDPVEREKEYIRERLSQMKERKYDLLRKITENRLNESVAKRMGEKKEIIAEYSMSIEARKHEEERKLLQKKLEELKRDAEHRKMFESVPEDVIKKLVDEKKEERKKIEVEVNELKEKKEEVAEIAESVENERKETQKAIAELERQMTFEQRRMKIKEQGATDRIEACNVKGLETELTETKTVITELSKKVEVLSEDKKKLEETYKKEVKEHHAIIREKEVIEQKLDQTEKDTDLVSTTKQRVTNVLKKAERKVNELKTKTESVRAEKETIKQKAEQMEAEIENVEVKQQEQINALAEAAAKKDEKEMELIDAESVLQEKMLERDKKIDQASRSVRVALAEEKHQKELASVGVQMQTAKLAEKAEDIAESLENISKEADRARRRKNDAEMALKKLNMELSEVSLSRELIEKEANEKKETLSKLKSEAEQEIKDNEKRMAILEEEKKQAEKEAIAAKMLSLSNEGLKHDNEHIEKTTISLKMSAEAEAEAKKRIDEKLKAMEDRAQALAKLLDEEQASVDIESSVTEEQKKLEMERLKRKLQREREKKEKMTASSSGLIVPEEMGKSLKEKAELSAKEEEIKRKKNEESLRLKKLKDEKEAAEKNISQLSSATASEEDKLLEIDRLLAEEAKKAKDIESKKSRLERKEIEVKVEAGKPKSKLDEFDMMMADAQQTLASLEAAKKKDSAQILQDIESEKEMISKKKTSETQKKLERAKQKLEEEVERAAKLSMMEVTKYKNQADTVQAQLAEIEQQIKSEKEKKKKHKKKDSPPVGEGDPSKV
eukprot:TRINITY_DN865_c0_g1_i1.p1 TRINITY_DN865_c0_g1~~TRINITY_DN865_c0_g1_i1.p1  ORF type:complete len:1036 (+),score=513.06 TRINITY_DN865_c0_g1_i1:502-3609(+)